MPVGAGAAVRDLYLSRWGATVEACCTERASDPAQYAKTLLRPTSPAHSIEMYLR
jgi:hypothetical protein